MVKPLACLCLIIAGWCLLPLPAQAAEPSGISITPPLQTITLQPEEELVALPIQVHNTNHTAVNLKLTSVDFGDLGQSGGVLFSGLTTTDFDQHHGLAAWMTLDLDQITVPAGAQVTITAHLLNSKSLTPGGHYGAVVVTEDSLTQAGQIGVTQSLASLLLVTKRGGEVYGIDLHKLQPDSSWWGSISGTTADFRNDGNTHVVPRGTVQVVDPLGRVIGKGIINADSAIILPDQSRTLTIPITQSGLALWPGTYKVVSHYRYDGTQVLQMRSQTFYQVGLLAPVLLVLLLALGGWWLQRRLQAD